MKQEKHSFKSKLIKTVLAQKIPTLDFFKKRYQIFTAISSLYVAATPSKELEKCHYSVCDKAYTNLISDTFWNLFAPKTQTQEFCQNNFTQFLE